jgi:apolipoprotein N-acyltransferase
VNVSTRAALAVASGLALALAFPNFDLDLAAWVAFVPLLYAIDGESHRNVFLYSWLQGFACYVASLYWITITLHHFADVRIVFAVMPMLLLAAVIALFSGAAVWAAGFVTARLGLSMIVTLPIAWTGIEWLRTYFPIGFPWNLLGYAAYRNLTLIQFAEFTGIYGISALIALFNIVVYVVFFRRESPRTQGIGLGALSALIVVAWVFGTMRIDGLEHERPKDSLKIAMVQGNIPQSIKWDPNFLGSSFSVYVQQTEEAARLGADLIVWPEAAAAFFFQPTELYPSAFAEDAPYRQRLLQLAVDSRVPILFGAPALGEVDGRLGFYNRAYLVSNVGAVTAWYDKIQLVPFGEYVPLRSLLGYFVNRVVEGFGDMFAGDRQTIFDLKGARLGVLICYESIFPNLSRMAVNRGADILVNITNDAWYGDSSAPYQLLAMTAMRAVETKVPVVRVANTGISAVIEPSGRIAARTPLFKRGTEIERVYWQPRRTIYTAVGDLFAEICFALAVIGLIWSYFRPRRLRQNDPEGVEDESTERYFSNGHGS